MEKGPEHGGDTMTKQLKSMSQIPQYPMDAWQVAAYLFGQAAIDENHLLASTAASQMEEAGWTFMEYDDTHGEEVWEPPENSRH